MTMTFKPVYSGALPLIGRSTPLYTVPGTATLGAVLKGIEVGNAVNGLPALFGNTSGNSGLLSFGAGFTTRFCAVQSPVDGTIFCGVNGGIWKIDPQGDVSIFAGAPEASAHTDGTGTAARFIGVLDLALDSTATNLYVMDGRTVRKIVVASAVVTTIAGTAPSTNGSADNATGTSATLGQSTFCIAPDDSALYLVPLGAGEGGGNIRKVALSGTFPVTTIVNNGALTGVGPANNTIAIDSAGAVIYFSDISGGSAVYGYNVGALNSGTGFSTGAIAAGAITTDWNDPDALYLHEASSNKIYRWSISRNLGEGLVYAAPAAGPSVDGLLGAAQSQGTLMCLKAAKGFLLAASDGAGTAPTSPAVGFSGIYRMHLTDGLWQRVAGGTYPSAIGSANSVMRGPNSIAKALYNSSGYFNLWVVPNGQTLGEAYCLIKNGRVGAGETLAMDLARSLAVGDKVYAEALTPGLTLNLSAAEMS